MYDDNNIFAKIIRSEIPCDKVYEDDNVLFFYDINPVAKVHVLGIPKIKCANFADFIEQTKVINKNLCRVLAWYDNEWGFSNRLVDLAKYIS